MDTKITTPSKKTLEAAIEWAGGQNALARVTGIKQQNICRWRQNNRVPAEGAVLIEEKTGGLFRREDFRPDLWPKVQIEREKESA